MAIEKVLVVDDEPIIRKSFEELLRGKRYGVTAVGTLHSAEKLLKRDPFDLIFLDLRLPDGEGTELLSLIAKQSTRPLTIMMSGFGSVEIAVECMRHGAFDYLIKPFSLSQVEVLVRKAENYQQVLKVCERLTAQGSDSSDLMGESTAIRALRARLRKVAPTEATVLIQGEPGSGQELAAHEIYRASSRTHAPYLTVDCAGAAPDNLESVLFGHEKGAFPAAIERREGQLELADSGTLLLAEIGEMPLHLQAKLLRFLQDREFGRMGGVKSLKADVRLIATTQRDLQQAVADGTFREDLYYRLGVFPLDVPPLRDRRTDIAALARSFLTRLARRHGIATPGFSEEAMALLTAHPWPGNDHELHTVIARAVLLTKPNTAVQSSALGLPSPDAIIGSHEPVEVVCPAEPILSLSELEKAHILRALEHTGGHRTKAAALLQISIRTLRNKLNEYRAGSPSPQ